MTSESDRWIATFGAFRLSPFTRELTRDGEPVILGDRALDILTVLIDSAGHIVSQKDLMERVWRGLVVTPGNLRVHMTALRKGLGDGYIRNVTGQGYLFAAPVTRTSIGETPASGSSVASHSSLPLALNRMIGRDDTVRTISADLRTDRFVTIVGPGGMGKTTVAVSVAHSLLEEFAGGVCFVDLSTLTDPRLVAVTVAATLGVSIQTADPLPALIAYLQKGRVLLVLDNCEHLIDAVAALTDRIFSHAPRTHILATSREALRVEGEHAHWLRPLESPAPDVAITAADALTFTAIRLFVDRATASDHRFRLTDENTALVAGICGRLDGIALAIELVAGRVGAYGLSGTAELLDTRLGLHWQGRRTSPPRHQTLRTLLDWSYGLLPPHEQQVLNRLSVFVGAFGMDAAHAVASSMGIDEDRFAQSIDQLVTKSLLSSVPKHDGATLYRLLETTRLYAAQKLDASGEAHATAKRHAQCCLRALRTEGAGRTQATLLHDQIGNVRAALEWCFGDHAGGQEEASSDLYINLAAAAAPVFLDLSLWSECIRWTGSALSQLPDAAKGGPCELLLQEARAMSSLLTAASDARTAIDRGLAIARQLGETQSRFRLLGSLHVYLLRMTDFEAGLSVAEEMAAVAHEANDVSLKVIADWILGSSHFVLGNPTVSRRHFEHGFSLPVEAGNRQQLAGLYYRTRALYGLARVLWLCGFPDRALRPAKQAIAEAAATGSPVNVSYSLVYNCFVFLWCGDLDTAQEMLDTVMAQPHWEGRLMWFHVEALALQGELLIRRGRIDEGVEVLRSALTDMQTASQKHLMLTVTACWLAEGLAAIRQRADALAVIDAAIIHSPSGEASWMAPELLRVRGSVLLSIGNFAEAQRSLLHSLALARQQGAKGWELRTATTLAQHYAAQGRRTDAHDELSGIYRQYTEGFETPDLLAARRLLDEVADAEGRQSICPPRMAIAAGSVD